MAECSWAGSSSQLELSRCGCARGEWNLPVGLPSSQPSPQTNSRSCWRTFLYLAYRMMAACLMKKSQQWWAVVFLRASGSHLFSKMDSSLPRCLQLCSALKRLHYSPSPCSRRPTQLSFMHQITTPSSNSVYAFSLLSRRPRDSTNIPKTVSITASLGSWLLSSLLARNSQGNWYGQAMKLLAWKKRGFSGKP